MFVGVSVIEILEFKRKKMKNMAKSFCTGLMLNDHSNPNIESSTILSDMLTFTLIKYTSL